MSIDTTVIDDEAGLAAIRKQWDDLAVRAGRPLSAPAWALAWWRNAAPGGAAARVVAVSEGERLIALAPLFTTGPKRLRATYQVMAARLSPPASLLVEPGREAEAAEALVAGLERSRPRPMAIRLWDRIDASAISARLAAPADGPSAWVHWTSRIPLPMIVLDGLSYDEWLAKRSSKFRQESRRLTRRLEDTGARFGLVEAADVDRALDAFVDLHGARWADRGGSNALVPGLKEMLAEAAAELGPAERMRIFAIETEGRPIAVNILLAAGGEVSGWNSGFDEDWRRFSPSLQLTMHAVADAAERGERRINLGPGRMDYKARLADEEEEMTLATVIRRDRAYPISRARFAPQQARAAISRQLSGRAKRRLRQLTRRSR